MSSEPTFRTNVVPADRAAVRDIVASTNFFSAEEIDVAVELVDEHLQTGEASGYYFLFAECSGVVAGYTCFGPIPCTQSSYDLYWIAVHQKFRGHGLGLKLMQRTEALIAARGGKRVYIETSSRPQYEPTRGFYLRCQYQQAALLTDYYADGDGKLIYERKLQDPA